jgi:hypothetical protein
MRELVVFCALVVVVGLLGMCALLWRYLVNRMRQQQQQQDSGQCYSKR